MKKVFVIINFLLWASLANAASIPAPIGTKLVWVAEKIIQNGLPLEIHSFNSELTNEGVLDFYRSEWAQSSHPEQPGYIENNVGEWRVISRLEGNKNTVVQVKNSAAGGAEGFISVSEPFATKRENKLAKNFPKMGGSKLISVTESDDSGKNATTIIYQNNFSVVSNFEYYKSAMGLSGWSLSHSFSQADTATLLFARQDAQSEVVISKGDSERVTIFANITTR